MSYTKNEENLPTIIFYYNGVAIKPVFTPILNPAFSLISPFSFIIDIFCGMNIP